MRSLLALASGAEGTTAGLLALAASAVAVALPVLLAAVLLRRLRLGSSRRAAEDPTTPRVILVTGASSGLGALLLDALRAAFPDAVVYGTSRGGWPIPSDPETSVEPSDRPLGVPFPSDDDAADPDDPSKEHAAAKEKPRSHHHHHAIPPLLALDVTSEASVSALFAAIRRRHGTLDCLVNNAGAVIATHASRTSDADASSQMETNFLGPVRVVRHACAAMKESLSKRILIVGSIGGRVGLPFQSMYSASKAAVMVYADALRTETKSDGFRVTLVEPGDMRPGMVNAAKAAGFDDDPIAKRATDIMRAEEARGTEMRVAAMAIVRAARQNAPPGRVLVGQDAWEVEMLTRLVPHWAREYLLASHYRVPPRDNAWIRI